MTTAFPRILHAVIALCALALGPLAAEPTPPPPVRTDLQERSTSWLSVVRVRIEPTQGATPGACQLLGPEDLVVEAQGRHLTGPKYLQLDRLKPPTLHALVLDNSASMVESFEDAKLAAKRYVDQLDTDRERALIMTFDENVVMRQAPTADRERLVATLDALRTGSHTTLLDAMDSAVGELDAHRERPVLILLSDGADTSSFHEERDIEALVEQRPDMAVFAIGIGMRTDEGNKPTREMLRRLASKTNGGFFEVTDGRSTAEVFSRIRDILDDEAVLTVVDPQGRPPDPRKLRVSSRNPECSVKVLHALSDESAPAAPIARPYPTVPRSLAGALDPQHFAALERGAERLRDPACADRLRDVGPAWYLDAASDVARGCVTDITRDHGRLFGPNGVVESVDRLELTTRPFEIPIVPFGALPRRPEEALERLGTRVLALAEPGGPPLSTTSPFTAYPYWMHGATYLELRATLAETAFLYPDYRDWALGRIAADAERDMALLIERYRKAFPGVTPSAVEAGARLSVEGRTIAARAETPSLADLGPLLAAWLGDIPAHDLFLRWERMRIERAIAGEPVPEFDERFVEAWRELWRIFAAPSHARVLTLLAPTHDASCDCVGYWRVELPRPGWMLARSDGQTAERDVTGDYLDLVPEAPGGWLAFERLAGETPGLVETLRQGGYRVADLSYELYGLPALRTPEGAFSEYRVALTLARGEGQEEQAFVLRADLRRGGAEDPAGLTYVDLAIESTEGALSPEIVEGLRGAGRRLLGIGEALPLAGAPSPAGTVALGSVPAPGSLGTEPPAGPAHLVERARARVVVVPVVVRRGDEALRNLTRENFELFDQGDRRRLRTVEFIDLSAGGRTPGPRPPREVLRQLLFLFDLSFSSPAATARARDAVLGSVERLHDSDLVAVAAYTTDRGPRLVLDFTTDRQALREAVRGLAPPGVDAEALAATEEKLERSRSRAAAGGGSRSGRGDEAASEHFADLESQVDSSGRRRGAARIETLFRDLGKLALWLRAIPGRKNVVLLSEGFDSSLVFAAADGLEQGAESESAERGELWEVDSQRRFGDMSLRSSLDAALEELRRADSPIEAVHLSVPGSAEGRSGEDGLHALARGTGGSLYPAASGLDMSLDRVFERTDQFYVLVFEPGDVVPDGRYHRLRVKLKDVPKGARADYRPGYFAPGPP